MEILWLGLITGLAGSLHCVGMCGPIALSLPLRGNSMVEKISGGVLYNIGRTVTYGLMGAFFGIIGQGFQLIGLQQWISIIMGALMIISVLIPTLFKPLKSTDILGFTTQVRKAIQKLFAQRSFGGLFLIGILNGLLPCGLVYVAIASAIGTGDLYISIGFMVLFGLGTLPMMLGINVVGNMLSLTVRKKITKAIPFIIVIIGIIFILRGLSLGIPFLSPPKQKMNPEFHMHQKQQNTPTQMLEGACCHDAGDSTQTIQLQPTMEKPCCNTPKSTKKENKFGRGV